MNSDLLQRFYQRILERGGELRPPLTTENLKQFERQLDLQLPRVIWELYLISNGTEYDDDMNHTMPLEELRFSRRGVFGDVIWFFEHCIFSNVWGVVVSSGQVIDWTDRLVAASVSDFLQKYIDQRELEFFC